MNNVRHGNSYLKCSVHMWGCFYKLYRQVHKSSEFWILLVFALFNTFNKSMGWD